MHARRRATTKALQHASCFARSFSHRVTPRTLRLSVARPSTMFKRVERRKKRQEKEEELGLDAETKEVLGLHDTDSEESESESEKDGSANENEDEDDAEELSDASGEEDQEDAEHDHDDEGSAEDSEDELVLPNISVTEAVRDPVYTVPLDPDVKACILCPGKLLKNTNMVDVHKSSKVSHQTRPRIPCPSISAIQGGIDSI